MRSIILYFRQTREAFVQLAPTFLMGLNEKGLFPSRACEVFVKSLSGFSGPYVSSKWKKSKITEADQVTAEHSILYIVTPRRVFAVRWCCHISCVCSVL